MVQIIGKSVADKKYASENDLVCKHYLNGDDYEKESHQGPPKLKDVILESTKNWFKNSTFHGKLDKIFEFQV